MSISSKKILVGITGGIAAYKTVDLVRRLREAGAEVRVVMTAAAKEFITPLTLQAVSGNPVSCDLLDPTAEAAMSHIELARWADVVLIAPASANFLARLTYGFANDLLSTLCLATTAPLIVVPAMNQQMWLNPATQSNITTLLNRGIHCFGPAEGSQACGEIGPGRMPEPLEILQYLNHFFSPKLFSNIRVIVTAGPTREHIDPVRYICNRSSGKMGFALAEAAANMGATVILITGPTYLATPPNVQRIDVETAAEMYEMVHQEVKTCNIFIAAAAVADYRITKPAAQKIKKTGTEINLNLIKNADIVASIVKLKNKPFTVGFAAETENLLKNAQKKLTEKKLDMIVANQVGSKETGFDSDFNQVVVLWNKGQQTFSLTTKKQLAYDLIELIAKHYRNSQKKH